MLFKGRLDFKIVKRCFLFGFLLILCESWAVACCELQIKLSYMDVIAPYIGGSATHTPLQQHNEVQMQGKCLFLIFSWGIDQPRSFLATLGAPKPLGLNWNSLHSMESRFRAEWKQWCNLALVWKAVICQCNEEVPVVSANNPILCPIFCQAVTKLCHPCVKATANI